MTTLLLLMVGAVFAVGRLGRGAATRAWSGPLLGLFFLLLFSLQHLFGFTDFFISDEKLYVELGRESSLRSLSDRYLWILINGVVLRHDWAPGGVPLKLLNLPLLAVTVVLLWRIFRRNDRILWLPVVLPYLAYTAIFNLRDIAIHLSTVSFVYLIEHEDRRLHPAALLPLAALYLLRPIMALLMALLYGAVVVFSRLRLLKSARLPRRGWLAMLAVLVVFAAVQQPVVERIQRYQTWVAFITGEGFESRVERRGLQEQYVSGSWTRRMGIAAVRYTATPIPTSLVSRMIAGEPHQWGVLDDLIRFFHQVSYYLLGVFIIIRYKSLIAALRTLDRRGALVLLALFSYLPLYSFYHFGVTHQRSKIPFQIAVFLLAALTHRYRYEAEQ